jgi:hypothetical protein
MSGKFANTAHSLGESTMLCDLKDNMFRASVAVCSAGCLRARPCLSIP